jgi:hypothetical protein
MSKYNPLLSKIDRKTRVKNRNILKCPMELFGFFWVFLIYNIYYYIIIIKYMGRADPANSARFSRRKFGSISAPKKKGFGLTNLFFFFFVWAGPKLVQPKARVNYFAPRMLNEFSFCMQGDEDEGKKKEEKGKDYLG